MVSRRQALRALTVGAFVSLPGPSLACGAEPFIGEICTFGYNFCPRGYAEADGRLLPINQNQALFSLLGTQYGGNGQVTFALPDLRGRVPVGVGAGPGLTPVVEGDAGGTETTTLGVANLPAHDHTASTAVTVNSTLRGTNSAGTVATPGGNVLAASSGKANVKPYSAGSSDTALSPNSIANTVTASTTVGPAGGGQPFDNRQPFTGIRYCIATQGIFPSRE